MTSVRSESVLVAVVWTSPSTAEVALVSRGVDASANGLVSIEADWIDETAVSAGARVSRAGVV